MMDMIYKYNIYIYIFIFFKKICVHTDTYSVFYSCYEEKMVASQSNSHRAGGERQGPSKGRGKGKAAKGAMERANRPDMHGDRDDALDDGGSSQSDEDSVADVDDDVRLTCRLTLLPARLWRRLLHDAAT